jgi:hypothetical protein
MFDPTNTKLYPGLTSSQWKHSTITFRMFFWLWLITTIIIIIMINLSGNIELSKETGGVLVLFLALMSVFWNFTFYYQKKIVVGDTTTQQTSFYKFLSYLYQCTAKNTLITPSKAKYWPCGNNTNKYVYHSLNNWFVRLGFLFPLALIITCGMIIGLGLIPYYILTKASKHISKD